MVNTKSQQQSHNLMHISFQEKKTHLKNDNCDCISSNIQFRRCIKNELILEEAIEEPFIGYLSSERDKNSC